MVRTWHHKTSEMQAPQAVRAREAAHARGDRSSFDYGRILICLDYPRIFLNMQGAQRRCSAFAVPLRLSEHPSLAMCPRASRLKPRLPTTPQVLATPNEVPVPVQAPGSDSKFV